MAPSILCRTVDGTIYTAIRLLSALGISAHQRGSAVCFASGLLQGTTQQSTWAPDPHLLHGIRDDDQNDDHRQVDKRHQASHDDSDPGMRRPFDLRIARAIPQTDNTQNDRGDSQQGSQQD